MDDMKGRDDCFRSNTDGEKEEPIYKVGMVVEWETFGGSKHEGTIVEVDGDEVIVICTDGKHRSVGI